MRKIKVCYLLNDFSIGGVSRVVFDSLADMDLQEFDVSIFLLSNNRDFLNAHELDESINVHICQYLFDADYSLRRYFILAYKWGIISKRAKDVVDEITKIKPDILHLHVLPRELVIGALVKKKLPAIHLIYTDHMARISKNDSTYIKRTLLAFIYRRLYRRYNLMAVSREVEDCQKKYGWRKKRLIHTRIENRISIHEYRSKEYSDHNKIEVIYVARLSPVKGHKFLLKAWARFHTLNMNLRLVGDGEIKNELQDYVKANKISNVIFEGVSNSVKSLLMRADIAVFSSFKEGLPIALLEKMAIGLPVVVRDIPELTDYITDDINGCVFSNETELGRKLVQLANDSKLREQLGRNARKSLIARMSDRSYADEIKDFYSRIVNT